MTTSPDIAASHDSTTIDVRGLSVVRRHETVLTIDQLVIPPGATALVGPNGSGKSTLLHTIAGLLEPATGSVSLPSGGSHHRPIAYVLQSQHASQHLLVTAREVVTLARAAERGPFRRLGAADRRIVDEAMERLEVADLGGRHLAEMSGGQRQRVFVAQGLAQGANILLLDEPLAGLDLASAQTIRRVIEEERGAGRIVVVATHDLDEAARADHVVMLKGYVVAAGSPTEVLTSEHLRAAYGGRVLELGGQVVAVDDGVHHDHHTDHPH